MSEIGLAERLKLKIEQQEESLINQTQQALSAMEKRLNDTLTKELSTIESGIQKRFGWSLKLINRSALITTFLIFSILLLGTWSLSKYLSHQSGQLLALQSQLTTLQSAIEEAKMMNISTDHLKISKCGKASKWCAKVDTKQMFGDSEIYYIIEEK